MAEKWVKIKGYEGLYEISDHGNVRRNGKLLKLIKDKDGYMIVSLSKENRAKKHIVHRLVADAFVNGRTDDKNMVNHINEIKEDNRASNLEWCTAKYNTNYNDMPNRRAEWCRKPIIAIKDGKQQRFNSISEAGRKLNISHGNISICLSDNRGRHTANGYSFIYEKGEK